MMSGDAATGAPGVWCDGRCAFDDCTTMRHDDSSSPEVVVVGVGAPVIVVGTSNTSTPAGALLPARLWSAVDSMCHKQMAPDPGGNIVDVCPDDGSAVDDVFHTPLNAAFKRRPRDLPRGWASSPVAPGGEAVSSSAGLSACGGSANDGSAAASSRIHRHME